MIVYLVKELIEIQPSKPIEYMVTFVIISKLLSYHEKKLYSVHNLNITCKRSQIKLGAVVPTIKSAVRLGRLGTT